LLYGSNAILSTALQSQLHNNNLMFLHHFFISSVSGTLGGTWLSGADLHLTPELSAEWDIFVQHLKASGIYLKTKEDHLIWTGGDRTGRITAKSVYNALAGLAWHTTSASWRQRIWKASCPLKCKLFSWLLLKNKLLFWDKLQTRGWEGPSRCSLCS